MKHKVLKTPINQIYNDNQNDLPKKNYLYNIININNKELFLKNRSQEINSNPTKSPKQIFSNSKDKNFFIMTINNKKSNNKNLALCKDTLNNTYKKLDYKNLNDFSTKKYKKLKHNEHSSLQNINQKFKITKNITKKMSNNAKSQSSSKKFSKTKKNIKNALISNTMTDSDSYDSYQKMNSLDKLNKLNSIKKKIEFQNLKNIQNKKLQKFTLISFNEKKNKPKEIINTSNDNDVILITDNEYETKSINKKNFLNETKILKLSSNPFFEQSKINSSRNNSPGPIIVKTCLNNNKINSKININNNNYFNSKENYIHHIKSSTIQSGNLSKCVDPKNILINTMSSKTNSITTNLNTENASLLAKTGILNSQKNFGDKPEILLIYQKFLSIAKRGDKEKFLQILSKIFSLPNEYININYKDTNGYSALHYACDEGNYKIVEILLNSNCDPNLENNEKKTGLHLSSKHGYFDISKLLLENGALINVKDSEKNTPLHYVCMNNHLELLNYYLTKFPRADEKNIYGNTPLDLTNNIEIKKILENYLGNSQNQYRNIKIHESSNSHLKTLTKNYSIYNEKFKTKMNIIDNNNNNLNNKININTPNYHTLARTKTFLENLIGEKRSPQRIIKRKKLQKEQFLSQNININKHKDYHINKSIKNDLVIKSKEIIDKTLINDCLKTNRENPTVNNLNISTLSIKRKNNSLSSISDKNMPEVRLKKKNIAQKNKKPKNKSLSNTKLLQECSSLENNTNTHISNTTLISNNINILTNSNNNCININNNSDFSKLNNMNINDNNLKKNNDSKNKNNTKNIKNKQCNNNNKKKTNNLTASKNNNIKNYNIIENKNTYTSKINKKELLNSIQPKNIIKRKKTKNNSFSDRKITIKNNINKKYSNENIDPKIINTINETTNIFSNINLNSIEEEKISLSSFICLALLGKGSFGEVYLVQKIDTKENYAMKVLRKEKIMNQNLLKYAMAERNVLSISNHPFIVKLNFAFQTNTKLFLIMEYCKGGDLSKHLYFEKRFSEQRAKFYICEILLGLEYLHKRDIIFRDLKPDNVVLDEKGFAKLADFGMSKEGVYDSQCAKSFCGSIAYLAPEVLKQKGHGKAVDWYLLGVLFYEMLVGVPPFFGNDQQSIFYNIEFGELVIPDFVSENAEKLLVKLLEKNPKKRLGGGKRDALEIKEDDYFKDVDWDKVYYKKIKPPKFKNYNNKSVKTYRYPKAFARDDKNVVNNKLIGWSFINSEDL